MLTVSSCWGYITGIWLSDNIVHSLKDFMIYNFTGDFQNENHKYLCMRSKKVSLFFQKQQRRDSAWSQASQLSQEEGGCMQACLLINWNALSQKTGYPPLMKSNSFLAWNTRQFDQHVGLNRDNRSTKSRQCYSCRHWTLRKSIWTLAAIQLLGLTAAVVPTENTPCYIYPPKRKQDLL